MTVEPDRGADGRSDPDADPFATDEPPATRSTGPEATRSGADSDAPPARPRPLVERIGLAVIALVFATLFGFVGVAAFELGEPFLGVMGLVGCLMTLWVGGISLFRR